MAKVDKTYYVVEWGVAFNHHERHFDKEWEAKEFIATHLFGDSCYCSFKKVEVLNADFEFKDFYDSSLNDRPEAQDGLFHNGICKR